ncbi:MAG: hypothetical protein LBM60_07715, partial [Clostridium sp.]|nr:hypothetical protein [Clostridium sp.]
MMGLISNLLTNLRKVNIGAELSDPDPQNKEECTAQSTEEMSVREIVLPTAPVLRDDLVIRTTYEFLGDDRIQPSGADILYRGMRLF